LIASKWAEESTRLKASFSSGICAVAVEGIIKRLGSDIWIASFDSANKSEAVGFLKLDFTKALSFDYRDSREAPPDVDYVSEVLTITYEDGFAIIYAPR
jgi:hypothetical protein